MSDIVPVMFNPSSLLTSSVQIPSINSPSINGYTNMITYSIIVMFILCLIKIIYDEIKIKNIINH